MSRLLISLDEADKCWLSHASAVENISLAALVRRAIHAYRTKWQKKPKKSLDTLLKNTKSTWSHQDGLVYQKKLREEWER